MTNTRLAAARVLLAVEAGRTTLAGALDRAQSRDRASRDAALLVELAAGALRWQGELDALIAAVSRRPVADLDAVVRAVLRIGVYQLRHLDRVPAHAVVHEGVESARSLGRPRATGFVNAVLRALARGEDAGALPPRPSAGAGREAQLAYLTVTLSHPAWLVERWLARVGFEATARWCAFNNTPPTLTVRARAGSSIEHIEMQLRAAGFAPEPSPFVPGALRLPPGTLGRIPAEIAAALRVQDEGSQLVAVATGARAGERVVDLCAAPGGKTMMLAEAMAAGDPASRSQLVAADYRPRRVSLLVNQLTAAGLEVPVVALDAARPLPFGPVFDRVLLDAPCSGVGTLRRDPDLKWTRRPEDLPMLAAAERTMLDRAAAIVRPGGRVVYATCSSEPEENLEVVRAFLASQPGFRLQPITMPAGNLVTPEGCLSTHPTAHGLDAFFAAVLVRQEGA